MDQEIYHSVLCLAAGINVLIAFVLIYTNFWYRNYTDYHRTRLLVALCQIVFSLCFIAYAWLGSDDMWLTGVVLSATPSDTVESLQEHRARKLQDTRKSVLDHPPLHVRRGSGARTGCICPRAQ